MAYASIYFIGMTGKDSNAQSSLNEIGYSDTHLTQQREAFDALNAGKVSDVEYDSWIATDVEEH